MSEWLPEDLIGQVAYLGAVLGTSLAVYWIARWGLVSGIRRVVRRSAMVWDDALVDAEVFVRLAHIAPALVIYYGIQLVPGMPETVVTLVQRVAIAVTVVVTAISVSAVLSAVNDIYSRNPEYRHRPIKGYLQVVKLFVFLLAALIVVSTLLDKSPWLFISGIGAMTAVLLLVFKDTILSLVASVQIASNDMIHVGDWIEMPQAGADGDVIDVALHTVKVQNWDKTISTIPTHKFIEESFKNWRGMSQSGGRRIKRSVSIDMNSIRFLTPEEIDRFESWLHLGDYIRDKQNDLAAHNSEARSNAPEREPANADLRRLTNIGTFRAYVHSYLRSHPKIHASGYTLIVRQLSPGAQGLPIELYCFTNDQAWDRYEGIQSDIFDHVLAILPDFGLRVFQSPAGSDLTALAIRES